MNRSKYNINFVGILLALAGLVSCKASENHLTTVHSVAQHEKIIDSLTDSLIAVTTQYPGEIGIAVITDCGDTAIVNNTVKYPLMSVFKLHQAIAISHWLSLHGTDLDTLLHLSRSRLNPETWSPMLQDHKDDTFKLPVKSLLEYTLTQSDNNASNYLFENLQPVTEVDSYVCSIIPRNSFQLKVTEADMWLNHSLAYHNVSSPLGAAMLINKVMTDSIVPAIYQDFIKTALYNCKTGVDRISASVANVPGVKVAHKTGSGFRDKNGILCAHNDVAYIQLPDGRHYTVSIFVKDFPGSEQEASEAITLLSSIIYNFIQRLYYT